MRALDVEKSLMIRLTVSTIQEFDGISIAVFSVRRYTHAIAIVILSVCPFLCLYVRSSVTLVIYAQTFNILKYFVRHTIVLFLVFNATFRSPEFTGSSRTMELNRGTSCHKR